MRVAVIQTAPAHDAREANLAQALERLREATAQGARLVVLPECAVSGYAIDDPDDARRLAEPLPGPTSIAIAQHCAEAGCSVVCGVLERDSAQLYNTAILIGPAGIIGRHRKAHIAPVGVDAFVTAGDRIDVFEAQQCRIGLSICYEVRFPELARTQALMGAQILVIAANWPAGAEVNPELMAPARAAENNVFVLAANRTGIEGSMSFIGRSLVLAPNGTHLAAAGTAEETLIADIEPTAGLGALTITSSRYDVDLRKHRRPELYSAITEPNL